MEDLNPYKAGGPGGISPRILREVAEELTPASSRRCQQALFQQTGGTHTLHPYSRKANSTTLLTTGQSSLHVSYAISWSTSWSAPSCSTLRPTALQELGFTWTSPAKAVLIVIEGNDNQYGFRRGRSCETQLLEFVEELTTSLEGGRHTDVIILDFAKAFDRVNRSLLAHKLHQGYGIRGSTITWIVSFLSDRRQAVVIDGSCSSFARVRSGVPQGSIPGPCLFLAYINYLPGKLTALSRSGDTAVYRVVYSDKDQVQLQQDFYRLMEWEESWDMLLHSVKRVSLPITGGRSPLDYSYELHGLTMTPFPARSTLITGITLQQDMDRDNDINNVVNKENRTLGFLRCSLKPDQLQRHKEKKRKKKHTRPILE